MADVTLNQPGSNLACPHCGSGLVIVIEFDQEEYDIDTYKAGEILAEDDVECTSCRWGGLAFELAHKD